MTYDLNQAKREILELTRIARLERPFLMGYYKQDEMYMLYSELARCLEVGHKKNIKLHFDTLTLAYLHLLDSCAITFALLVGYRSAFVEAWEKETDQSSPMHLSYSLERVQPDATNALPRDVIHNATHYDTLVANGRTFYLAALRTHDADKTLVSGYVIMEKETLENLEEPYIHYHDELHELKTRIDNFITENSLSERLGDEFLNTRKAALFEWLELRFRSFNQIIVFDNQEREGEVPHTMRQLLTSMTYDDTSDLFINMLGNALWLRGTQRRIKFYVACHEYRNDDASLLKFMRENPNLLANTPGTSIKVYDVAVVKDVKGKIVSMRFLSKPEPLKQESFVARCKEKVDKERRVSYADRKSLIETSREILIPYLDEVRHFFEPDHGEMQIPNDATTHLLERMREITDRESGLDGAFRTIKGCILHTLNKAKEALDNGDPFHDDDDGNSGLTLTRSMIALNQFEQGGVNASSFIARELIRDNENRRVLQHHHEQQTDVSTLSVMRGREVLSRTVVPCMIKNCYKTYVTTNNNNTIIINQYDKSESTKRIKEYEKIIEQLVEEDDTETRRAIKAGLYEEHPPTVTKKRKRIAVEQPSTPRKKLMTKREAEVAAQAGEFDAAITIVIEGERNDTPNLKSSKVCDYCEKKRKLRSFHTTNVGTKKGVKMTYSYIRNVCHTCVALKNKG